MFVPEYMWPQITRSHPTWLQWSRLQFAVHVWTLGKAVLGRLTPSALFFLFKIFSWIWDAIKPNFQPHFVFEMKDLHPFYNSRWQHTCWFFQVNTNIDIQSQKSWDFLLLTWNCQLQSAVDTPNMDLKLSNSRTGVPANFCKHFVPPTVSL